MASHSGLKEKNGFANKFGKRVSGIFFPSMKGGVGAHNYIYSTSATERRLPGKAVSPLLVPHQVYTETITEQQQEQT